MKITTGIDIIEVERIKKAIDEGVFFLLICGSYYTEKEIKYCNKFKMAKYEHFAARFAVKEAVFKAISEFISGREDALWRNIEIENIDGGKPVINVERLQENLKKTVNKFELKDIDVSISHIEDYAVASVVALFE